LDASGSGSLHLPDQRVPGSHFIIALAKKAADVGVDIRVNNDGYELVQENGQGSRVTGIKIGVNPSGPTRPAPAGGRTYDYSYTLSTAKAVVIATGGFAYNVDLKKQYFPYTVENLLDWSKNPNAAADKARFTEFFINQLNSTQCEGLTGDGQLMAEKAGAYLDGMHLFSRNYAGIAVPTSAQQNSLSLASVRDRGAINVGSDGKRLLQRENDATFHENGNWPADDKVWMVINHRNYIAEIGNIRDYYLSGLVMSDPTLQGLAKKMGLEGAAITNFEATMNEIMSDAQRYAAFQQVQTPNGWSTNVQGSALRRLSGTVWDTKLSDNDDVTTNDQDEFDAAVAAGTIEASSFANPVYDGNRRTIGWHWGNSPTVGPYYAFRNVPGVHGTWGGLTVDIGGRALTESGAIIPGLYGAGTCAWVNNWTAGAAVYPGGSLTTYAATKGYAAAMAIIGEPLYTDWGGREGPIAGDSPLVITP
jgi:hypothetical protein